MTTHELESTPQSLCLFCVHGDFLKEKRRTSNKERKLGDRFFPTVFPVAILICGKNLVGVGLLGLQKRIWEGVSERHSVSAFRYLKGLHQGGKKKSHLLSQNRDPGPSLQQEGCGQTGGKTSHPPENWHRLAFIAVTYINKGGAPSLKCVERILTSADTGKSSMSNDLLAAPTTLQAMRGAQMLSSV